MIITHTQGRYTALCSYEERVRVKSAGFFWNPQSRVWYAPRTEIALRLRDCFDGIAEKALNGFTPSAKPSTLTNYQIDIPCPPGLEYMPFQKAGIAYAIKRKHTLIADEMGLGKTIQAIGVMNLTGAKRALVIVPASLKLNWQRELETWLVNKSLEVIVCKPRIKESLVPENDFVLIQSYDSISKNPFLKDIAWDIVVLDEVHYLKSIRSRRKKAVLGGRDYPAFTYKRMLALSGTPILNRPAELWPLLRVFDRNGLGSDFRFYEDRYCGVRQGKFGTFYETNPAKLKHLEELQTILRERFMIRRMKADVLKELPDKRYQVITFEHKNAAKLEQEALKTIGDYTLEDLTFPNSFELRENLMRIRHETALAKVLHVLAHVQSCLESGIEKVIVFAHHRDVIEALADGLKEYLPAQHHGGIAQDVRDKEISRFQTDRSCRVLIAGLKTAQGYTATASAHVIFAELDFTPSVMAQAEDRCHRIGQKTAVLVQYIVIAGTLDYHIAEMLVKKALICSRTLDQDKATAPNGTRTPQTGQESIQSLS